MKKILMLTMLMLLCLSWTASAEDKPVSVTEEVDAILQQTYGSYTVFAGTCVNSDTGESDNLNSIYAFIVQHGDEYALSVIEKTDGQYRLAVNNPSIQAGGVLPDHLLLDTVEQQNENGETVRKSRLSCRYEFNDETGTVLDVAADSIAGTSVWEIDNVLCTCNSSEHTLKWMPHTLLVTESDWFDDPEEWSIPLSKQFASSDLSSFSADELLSHLHFDHYISFAVEAAPAFAAPEGIGKKLFTITAEEPFICLFSVDSWQYVEQPDSGIAFFRYGFVQSSLIAPRIYGRSDECEIRIPDEAYQHFSPEDIRSAVEAIIKYNHSTAGEILELIEYDEELMSYSSQMDGSDRYEDVIAFYTDFSYEDHRYQIGGNEAEGGWEMWLGRNGNGPWEIFNQGY